MVFRRGDQQGPEEDVTEAAGRCCAGCYRSHALQKPHVQTLQP